MFKRPCVAHFGPVASGRHTFAVCKTATSPTERSDASEMQVISNASRPPASVAFFSAAARPYRACSEAIYERPDACTILQPLQRDDTLSIEVHPVQ